MSRHTLIINSTVAALVLGFATVAAAGNGPLPNDLERVRGALARYNSVEQAENDGYVAASPCEETAEGAMGVHYVNTALFGPGIDPLQPEVLLYLPDEDGKQKLVGVEYFSVDADQQLSTDDDRPTLFGQPFDGPMAGHGPGMPIHYDLHVWLYEANPAGTFTAWNPSLSCP